MSKFIVISFAFMGWAFWELSGGADFEPEVRAEPVFKAAPSVVAQTKSDPVVSPSFSTKQAPVEEVVLAAAVQPEAAPKPVVVQPKPVEVISVVAQVEQVQETVAVEPAPEVIADLREITGSRVNMRTGPGTSFSVVTKLEKGTSVEVLADEGDGWLKLRVVDTGRVGFMADWLVTAQAN